MKVKKADFSVVVITSGEIKPAVFPTGVFAGESSFDVPLLVLEAGSLLVYSEAIPVREKGEDFDLYEINLRLRGNRKPHEGDTDTQERGDTMEATE